MTIEKTRKMLGLSEEKYSDEEVELIIGKTQVLARIFIDHYMQERHKIKVPPRPDLNSEKSTSFMNKRKTKKKTKAINCW